MRQLHPAMSALDSIYYISPFRWHKAWGTVVPSELYPLISPRDPRSSWLWGLTLSERRLIVILKTTIVGTNPLRMWTCRFDTEITWLCSLFWVELKIQCSLFWDELKIQCSLFWVELKIQCSLVWVELKIQCSLFWVWLYCTSDGPNPSHAFVYCAMSFAAVSSWTPPNHRVILFLSWSVPCWCYYLAMK
jgi:hypothetical protein